MIRTFIALDIPPVAKTAIEELIGELRGADAAVSWVRPESIHLTLKFLGNVETERIAEISTAMEAAAAPVPAFRLQPSACGAFPSIQQARIVWAGLRGDDEPLKLLQKRVEEALAPLGFEPEGRPFKPHLTIGRVKGRRGLRSLQEILLARRTFETEVFDVTEIILYKSELRPDGARYTPLFRAPLAGRSGT
ncbi:MAG: RNA 2',3'-cyclic phosphodiesterase [Acidobacteriota bacterium]